MGQPALCLVGGLDYHVVARCRDGVPLFERPEDRRAAVAALASFRRGRSFRLYGYIVMPEHIHLFLAAPPGTSASRLVSELLVAMSSGRGSGKTSWDLPCSVTAIEPGEATLRCLRYIDRNPVRRRLVRRPSEYPWGSFRCYGWGETNPAVDLHPSYLALGTEPAARQRRYVARVNGPYDEGLDHRQPEFSDGGAYGSPEFLTAVARLRQPRSRRRVGGGGEVPAPPRAAAGREV